MKKIFWTTMFRIVIIFLFWSYIRLFDHNLGQKIGGWFVKNDLCTVTVTTGLQLSGLDDQLLAIQMQLGDLGQKLGSLATDSTTLSSLPSFATTTPSKVSLYYFNQKEDAKLPPEQQINVDSILPVYRTLPASDNILKDTIELLIQGNITASEESKGYMTEFPNSRFRLLSTNLDTNGILTLEFTEVPGFTDGGSARMLIMANSIVKTAEQFPGVKRVEFIPETLFQP